MDVFINPEGDPNEGVKACRRRPIDQLYDNRRLDEARTDHPEPCCPRCNLSAPTRCCDLCDPSVHDFVKGKVADIAQQPVKRPRVTGQLGPMDEDDRRFKQFLLKFREMLRNEVFGHGPGYCDASYVMSNEVVERLVLLRQQGTHRDLKSFSERCNQWPLWSTHGQRLFSEVIQSNLPEPSSTGTSKKPKKDAGSVLKDKAMNTLASPRVNKCSFCHRSGHKVSTCAEAKAKGHTVKPRQKKAHSSINRPTELVQPTEGKENANSNSARPVDQTDTSTME